MSEERTFQTGGTLDPNRHHYIVRAADQDLFTHCLAGEYVYLLSASQNGKSSMMIRTSNALRQEGVLPIIVDLHRIGADSSTVEQWYASLFTELYDPIAELRGLKRVERRKYIPQWTEENSHYTPADRFYRLLQEEIVTATDQRVVIFIDEIGTLVGSPLKIDFLATIRALYNARSKDLPLRRVSFVLIGNVPAHELFDAPGRVQFNFGTQLELTDFQAHEAEPLAGGLGPTADQQQKTLGWIFHWTNGHPYFTHRLCEYISQSLTASPNSPALLEATAVDDAVQQIFVAQKEQDLNLRNVESYLTKPQQQNERNAILSTYRSLLWGILRVREKPDSLAHSHLKFAGVATARDGNLYLRNRIYRTIFNHTWLNEQHSIWKWFLQSPPEFKAVSAMVVVLLLFAAMMAFIATGQAQNAQREANRAVAAEATAQAEATKAIRAEATAVAEAANARTAEANALNEAERADRQENITLSRGLAAEANIQLYEKDPTLALLLATEAISRTQQMDALSVLYEAETNLNMFHEIMRNADQATAESEIAQWQEYTDTLTVYDKSSYQPLISLLHPTAVTEGTLSNDQKRVLSWDQDGTAYIWDIESGSIIDTLNHPLPIAAAAWSQDDRMVLTASRDGTVGIWDVDTGAQLHTLLHDRAAVGALWSYDGQQILSWDEGGLVSQWAAPFDSPFATHQHQDGVQSVIVSDDGKMAISFGASELNIWNLSARGEPVKIQGENNFGGAKLNHTGNTLLTWNWGQEAAISLWNAKNGAKIRTFSIPADSPELEGYQSPIDVEWSSGDDKLLLQLEDATARLFDANTGSQLAVMQQEGQLYGAAWNEDETQVMTWGKDGLARVWDGTTGRELFSVGGLGGQMWSGSWSQNEKHIFTESLSLNAPRLQLQHSIDIQHDFAIWDARTGELLGVNVLDDVDASNLVLQHPANQVVSEDPLDNSVFADYFNQSNVRASQDDSLLLTWSREQAVVWDQKRGGQLVTLRPNYAISQAAWAEGNDLILTRGYENQITFWDARNGVQVSRDLPDFTAMNSIWSHSGNQILLWDGSGSAQIWDFAQNAWGAQLDLPQSILSVSWSSDDRHIAGSSSGEAENAIMLWDVESGQRLSDVPSTLIPTQISIGIDWSIRGNYLLAQNSGNLVQIWDMQNAKLSTFPDPYPVRGQRWNKDGSKVLTWSGDFAYGAGMLGEDIGGEVTIRDLKTGTIQTFPHELMVDGAMWNHDESQLLTWDSGNLFIWDMATGEKLVSLRQIFSTVGASWSNDGKRIYTWSRDGRITQWLLDPAELYQEACRLVPRDFTATEWQFYFPGETFRPTCPAHPHILAAAEMAGREGDLWRAERLFQRAVDVAAGEDGVALRINPHAEALRYTLPSLVSNANEAAVSCQIAEATALYQQIDALQPNYFDTAPDLLATTLAERAGCNDGK